MATATIAPMSSFSVRCLFALDSNTYGLDASAYEERVTIWDASSEDEAIALAEAEAEEYADDVSARYLGLAQSYRMYDHPGVGAEIFSLIRSSNLAENDYLATFFTTGGEHQRHSSSTTDSSAGTP